jgi:hypothetical protein
MKRFIIFVLLLFFWNANAQESGNSLLDRMCANVAESCVTIDYAYTARLSGIDNIASGNLMTQGEKWVMRGNGIEMYCDGKSVWIVDPALKEVVIEPLQELQETEFLTNPAMAFVNVNDNFNVNTVNPSSDSKALIYSLVPKNGEMEFLNIELYQDTALIRSMSFALKDGTLVTIKVSSMKLTPKISDETFKPRTVFDSNWIVTDLR